MGFCLDSQQEDDISSPTSELIHDLSTDAASPPLIIPFSCPSHSTSTGRGGLAFHPRPQTLIALSVFLLPTPIRNPPRTRTGQDIQSVGISDQPAQPGDNSAPRKLREGQLRRQEVRRGL